MNINIGLLQCPVRRRFPPVWGSKTPLEAWSCLLNLLLSPGSSHSNLTAPLSAFILINPIMSCSDVKLNKTPPCHRSSEAPSKETCSSLVAFLPQVPCVPTLPCLILSISVSPGETAWRFVVLLLLRERDVLSCQMIWNRVISWCERVLIRYFGKSLILGIYTFGYCERRCTKCWNSVKSPGYVLVHKKRFKSAVFFFTLMWFWLSILAITIP